MSSTPARRSGSTDATFCKDRRGGGWYRHNFQLGLRLSCERMGMQLGEVRTLCQQLMAEGQLDYLDLSLWDVFKDPEEAAFKGRPLISWFTELDRGATRLGVAGNVRSGTTAPACLEAGADFVLIGRAAIANHDFPRRVLQATDFEMPPLPLTREHLIGEGVSPAFSIAHRGSHSARSSAFAVKLGRKGIGGRNCLNISIT